MSGQVCAGAEWLRAGAARACAAGLVAAAVTLATPAVAEAPLIAVPFDDDADAASIDPGEFSEDRFADTRRRVADDAAAAAPAPWVSPLRPMRVSSMQTGSVWRFTGERHSEAFTLHVGDPAMAGRLRLRLMSTVNVLPERSSLRVQVNGSELGEVTLRSFTGFTDMYLDLPEGVLVSGRNAVRLDVAQHHRIFCGPDASWALWTELDLAESGLEVDPGHVTPSAQAFLMALAAQAASGGAIEVRGTAALGEARTEWLRALTAQLGRAMSGKPLAFDFTGHWTVRPQTPARARVSVLPGAENRLRFVTGADGAQVLVVEFVPGAPAEAMPDLSAALPAMAQSERPPLIEPGREVALAEFGVEAERFAERFARREHAFRLPDDWLVLTAEKARLRLDYIYADGLPEGSVLVLFMNDEPIRMLPLWGDPNNYITRFPIDFEARHLTSGTNIFAFEVLIPGDPPDMPCAGARGAVLEIAASSTLDVPDSPSMFLPDMGLAFSALTPDSLVTNDLTHRAFDPEDSLVLGAALARAGAGYRPAHLHLMALEDLGSVPLGRYSVERRLLEDVLAPITRGMPGDGPGAAPSAQPDPFRFVQEARGSRAALVGWWDWVMGHAGDFLQWVNPRTEDRLNEWLERQQGQAVFLHLDHRRPDQIWMLRSTDADIGDIAAAVVAARTIGEGPRGQVSVLDHDGTWRNWLAPDRQPVMLEPWTLANFRSAMGNLVSARPITFVFILFFLTLVSAALALRLVISTREHDR